MVRGGGIHAKSGGARRLLERGGGGFYYCLRMGNACSGDERLPGELAVFPFGLPLRIVCLLCKAALFLSFIRSFRGNS